MVNKSTIVGILESTKADVTEAYQISTNSPKTDRYLMKALGRIETLLKVIRES